MRLPSAISASCTLLALTFAFSALGQNQPGFDPFNAEAGKPAFSAAPKAPTSEVEFLSEVESIAPGKPFTVLIRLTHPEPWHSYYVNTGAVGLVLRPGWKLPEGFEAERVAWPTPHIGSTAGLNTYGYEGTVYHLFTITPPAKLEIGSTVEITAKPMWQICDEKNCVQEPPFGKSQPYTLELPIAAEAKVNAANSDSFEAARAMLPMPLPEDLSVEAFRTASTVTMFLSPAFAVPEEKIHFFDNDGQLEAQAKPAVERTEDGVSWSLQRKKDFDAPDQLAGVLAIGEQGYAVDVKFSKPPPEPVAFGKLLQILGGMFIGGMILNLMPCVFPVIGLKIMSFVQQAGEKRSKIAMHGFIFAGGVVLSFWVLAGFLLGLREGFLGSGGGDVGWGYQLQNPWMIWGLMLVMFLLALNMYGVFEIGTSATGVGGNLAQKQGVTGTFFSGVLATVVATPCSAPFLGAALGATFVLPSSLFMLSFTSMALGLAFPYLILSIFPQLIQLLPRPGPWMESFKQSMSFLLFATAGYLLWVYIIQIDIGSMLNVVIGLTAIATATWIYGRWCPFTRKKQTRIVGAVFAVAFAALGLATSKPPGEDKLPWEKWSPEAVEEALENGQPVYVDFTAAWCLTCQANKKNAYSMKVREIFEEKNVLLLKADKTKPVPEIDAAIQELGRLAIPVNVLYVPGDGEPHLTKELLGAGYLFDFLTERLPEAATGE